MTVDTVPRTEVPRVADAGSRPIFRIADWLLPAALVWALNAVWLARDTRPPVWDMALHQSYAFNYLGVGAGDDLAWWERSGPYPPFVHLAVSVFYRLFHPSFRVAALSNVPATLLLFWAVFGLARLLSGRRAALWAVWLTALTPYLLFMSKETVLDYWLSAWVASGLFFLHRTEGFLSRRWSLLLGVALGFGMLTKWIFAPYLFWPILAVIVERRAWRDVNRMVRLADAILVAALIAGPWYLPNIPRLVRYLGENAGFGAREGEPPVLTFQSWIYYLRLLEGYQLFAALFAVVVAACVAVWRRKLLKGWALTAAIGGGWVTMTMLRTKDPRFTMPLLGLFAVIAGVWIASWQRGRWANAARVLLVAVLGLQAYAASFGVSWLPREVVLLRGYQGSLRWDWNLYLQDYFGILGPPRREDWRQADILQKLNEHGEATGAKRTLAVIPDLPRFNAANFLLYSRLLRVPLTVDHLQREPHGESSFDGFNYVVMIDGGQGMSWTTVHSAALTRIVVDEPEVFRLLGLFCLPNGDTARLYRIVRNEKVPA
jgi:Dolichyl-phosphate-mannose-protein mannosyltransferase